ncbi:MAG: DUF998 domain-containing protein [Flavobacteriaceae bacterium]|nr:DUF998 domain-containing protein [Bacteroidia bacterium]NNL60940.1 DUF998 domain-containing protein [Flavobacteriaceae bacterium]
MKIETIIKDTQFLPITFILMLLVIFILPFYSFPEYSIFKNTTSHLGAQLTPNAWVLNTTFVLLGVATLIDGWRFLRFFWVHKVILFVFGISLIACAFFQHAPIIKEMPIDLQEDLWHARFANLTGLSFTVFAIASSFLLNGWFQRTLAILIGIIAVLLSVLMFEYEELMGVWQRLIFICSFGWMMFVFNRTKKFI